MNKDDGAGAIVGADVGIGFGTVVRGGPCAQSPENRVDTRAAH